ncbi:MAG: NUDIX hydrolase [Flammeovirgaceae bacterium]|nr:NUDIX hydrolase [Flammeovirgaceae bacterium]
MTEEIKAVYGNKVRIRVCGLAFQEDKLLMVNHQSLSKRNLWAPPGGGIDFGETTGQSLEREFLEETGLQIAVRDFLFVCEFINGPLHAIELFFSAEIRGGKVQTGNDPETRKQIIREVRFLSQYEIDIIPTDEKHGIFRIGKTFGALKNLRGFYKI